MEKGHVLEIFVMWWQETKREFSLSLHNFYLMLVNAVHTRVDHRNCTPNCVPVRVTLEPNQGK